MSEEKETRRRDVDIGGGKERSMEEKKRKKFVDEDHTCSSFIPLSTWKKKAGIVAKLIVDALLQRFLPLPRCRIETAQAQDSTCPSVIGGLLSKIEATDYLKWDSVLESLYCALNDEGYRKSNRILVVGGVYRIPLALRSLEATDYLKWDSVLEDLYCALNEEDHVIKRMRLIHLWVAGGFIKEHLGKKKLEEVASNYFGQLIERNMLQIHENAFTVRLRACKLHDLVYRGMFPSGETVAIKRAQQGSMQGRGEFKTEIELLSRVHHKNVVGLVGFYFEQGKQMLVYEFIPNGTLREGLSGFARGLTYLHELANPSIIHRDVKSTNILLDEKLTAKVADFGLSKLTAKRGMYPLKLKLTDNSDVYSFGVVMLELISARQLIEKGKYIVREVRTALYKNSEHYGLKKITDPGIRNSGILIGFERFVELAMQCVEESAAERTSMSDVVKEIDRGTRTDDPTACKMHYL
ncbi:hypothetical protein GIB67_006657 [Kingdonia uniflora]|uniref:Protein kinase domain-containing protein n=1 Tax=Kingdonia uniflora TaxID=39325 RepID=A0A7J7LAX2_9MAGN|nr:hypothetical protein GIB67_006657 [Kingdonia uniflora]